MATYPRTSAGHDGSSWPVLLLLLTVLVPTGGVVWMMRAAMENERLAVRQRLADAYRVQLDGARKRVGEQWKERLKQLDVTAGDGPPAMAFVNCVASGLADSVLVLADDRRVAYPAPTSPTKSEAAAASPEFYRAVRLEFVARDSAQAAAAYEAAARDSADPHLAARAMQSQARCLLNAGDREKAMGVLQDLRARNDATDALGRSLAADAELRLLELMEPKVDERAAVATSLRNRVMRYEAPALPAEQRRFLMHRLTELDPAEPILPTLAAEDLAAEVAAALTAAPPVGPLLPTGAPGVWCARSPKGNIVALFRAATLERHFHQSLADLPLPPGVTFEIRRPSQVDDARDDILSGPLGTALPGWRLALDVGGDQGSDASAEGRRAFYAWIAAAVVATTLALAWLVADSLRRQMRVARLKNDLVATVSHELKTPLASIRLLVDSLLEPNSDGAAPQANGQAREYLELIAQENARLSRLIDNFLTFSRMERGKHQFHFEPIDARDVVAPAVAAVASRFDGVQAELHVALEGPLPIRGDVDALATAVVNLLDNAWKYTGEVKRATLTARRVDRRVEISVEDNGVGLSARAARRVFDRFYQVDQRLARTQGGCGLGLSIVRYIVEAHGGQASVESRPGQGSKFTLSLPVDVDAPAPGPLPSPSTGEGART